MGRSTKGLDVDKPENVHLTVFRRNGRDQKQEKPQSMWGKRYLSLTVITLVSHIKCGILFLLCQALPWGAGVQGTHSALLVASTDLGHSEKST